MAEKIGVSRQAISRWKVGATQQDASNILQLSKLFQATSDYLLNDDYGSDPDIPAIKRNETSTKVKMRKMIALCISAFGVFGIFILYILSRMIEVMVPYISYENGEKVYTWRGNLTGHSYKYFIQEYDLELLVLLFSGLLLVGLIYILMHSHKAKEVIAKFKDKMHFTDKK